MDMLVLRGGCTVSREMAAPALCEGIEKRH